MELVIVNWPDDCLDYIKNNSQKNVDDFIFIATHSFVKYYLADNEEFKKYKCIDITEFITNEEIIKVNENADFETKNIIEKTDLELASAISEFFSIPKMKYFELIYHNRGTYEYVTVKKFSICYENILKKYAIDNVVFYDFPVARLFTTIGSPVGFFTEKFFALKKIPCNIRKSPSECKCFDRIYYKAPSSVMNTKRVNRILNRIVPYLAKKLCVFWKKILSSVKSPVKKVVLIDPLYDLDFLKYSLLNFDTTVISNAQIFKLDISKFSANIEEFKGRIGQSLKNIIDGLDSCEAKTLLWAIRDDIVSGNLYPFYFMHHALKNNFFENLWALIWGNSPADGFCQLVIKYCRDKGIPVFGMQHGAYYGVQDCSYIHYSLDYKWCDHFFTYGFSQKDIDALPQTRKASCDFIPVGTCLFRPVGFGIAKRKYDIFYPMTNCIFFTRDTVGYRMDQITSAQEKIIEHLEGLKDYKILISIFPDKLGYSNALNCKLKKLKNCDVIAERINELVYHSSFDSIILDSTSTQLYALLGYNSEIFCVREPTIKYTENADELINRRVHFYDDPDRLFEGFKSYMKGTMASKRDDGFYKAYVCKRGTEKNIVRVINKLVKQ